MGERVVTAWEWGDWGERTVRKWYRDQGYFVVPTSAIEMGGAPKLVGLLQAHVLPDMQAAQAGEMRWVEIKFKTAPVLYRKTGTWRHGVDLSNWLAYLEVERITGIPGELAIVQLRPGPKADSSLLLLRATFATLRGLGQEITYPDGKDVVVWDVDRFDRFPITDHAIPDLRSLRSVVHPWEQPGADGVAPQMGPKQEMFPW